MLSSNSGVSNCQPWAYTRSSGTWHITDYTTVLIFPFQWQCGALQGLVFSTLLFNIYVYEVVGRDHLSPWGEISSVCWWYPTINLPLAILLIPYLSSLCSLNGKQCCCKLLRVSEVRKVIQKFSKQTNGCSWTLMTEWGLCLEDGFWDPLIQACVIFGIRWDCSALNRLCRLETPAQIAGASYD